MRTRKVRSVFKYARPPPSNLCAATNISKSFPPRLLLRLFPLFRRGRRRRENDSLPRDSHDNNASAKVSQRETNDGEGKKERNGLWRGQAERTKRESREPKNIFENLSRLLETTGAPRIRVDTRKGRVGRGEGRNEPERRRRKRLRLKASLGRFQREITTRGRREREKRDAVYANYKASDVVASGSLSLSFSRCVFHTHARAYNGSDRSTGSFGDLAGGFPFLLRDPSRYTAFWYLESRGRRAPSGDRIYSAYSATKNAD